jgi:RNA-directed DNA polymerase
MDYLILKKFLKAGFMENRRLNPTEKGVSQGAVISPALTVLVLSGLKRKSFRQVRAERNARRSTS